MLAFRSNYRGRSNVVKTGFGARPTTVHGSHTGRKAFARSPDSRKYIDGYARHGYIRAHGYEDGNTRPGMREGSWPIATKDVGLYAAKLRLHLPPSSGVAIRRLQSTCSERVCSGERRQLNPAAIVAATSPVLSCGILLWTSVGPVIGPCWTPSLTPKTLASRSSSARRRTPRRTSYPRTPVSRWSLIPATAETPLTCPSRHQALNKDFRAVCDAAY